MCDESFRYECDWYATKQGHTGGPIIQNLTCVHGQSFRKMCSSFKVYYLVLPLCGMIKDSIEHCNMLIDNLKTLSL